MESARDARPGDEAQRDPGDALCLQVADVIGGLMELWGFKRIMGRTWTVLYLSPEPLTAADLARVLQISTGNVSMTVSELLKWGVIKKTWVPGDRRDHYQPETSIWKMVSRVFRERELVHIDDAIAAFRAALATAAQHGEADARLRFLTERVETLLGLAERGRALLELLLSGRLRDAPELPSALDTKPG